VVPVANTNTPFVDIDSPDQLSLDNNIKVSSGLFLISQEKKN